MLASLRELQRTFDLAVAVVHHLSKRTRARPGQALRGSSDLRGWLDCGAYLSRDQDDQLRLTLEHRSAPAPDPIALAVVSRPDGSATHLEVVGTTRPTADPTPPSIHDRVLASLRQSSQPVSRSVLRRYLKVQNQRLGMVLAELEAKGAIRRSDDGWLVGPLELSPDRSRANAPRAVLLYRLAVRPWSRPALAS